MFLLTLCLLCASILKEGISFTRQVFVRSVRLHRHASPSLHRLAKRELHHLEGLEAEDEEEEVLDIENWSMFDNLYVGQNITDAEVQEAMDIAFGDNHIAEMNRLIEEAIEEEWDAVEGVHLPRTREKPLKVNLDLWNYEAKQEMLRGNFSAASQIYSHCISYDRTDGRAYLGIARILWKRGKAEEAESAYDEGLYYCPENPFLLQAKAMFLEKQGRLEEAKRALKASVRSHPDHAASWVALSQLQIREGKIDQAKECLESAVKHSPTSYVALQTWGCLEARYGDKQRARELFEKALAIAPESGHTLHSWAVLERDDGFLHRALELYKKMSSIRPGLPKALLGIAEIQELMGNHALARETYANGVTSARQQGYGGLFQAWALFELRQLTTLTKQVLRALSQSYSPSNLPLLKLELLGNNLREELAMTVFDISEGSTRPRLDRVAVMLRVVDAFDLANATSSKSIQQLDPTLAKSLLILYRDLSTVRRLFDRALDTHKYHSSTYTAYAQLETRLGNYEKARKLLISGISRFPQSKNQGYFQLALARLYTAQGEQPTARACYQRALEATPPQRQVKVYIDYLQSELNLQSSGKSAQRELRKLAERALNLFPSHPRIRSMYELCQESPSPAS
eukprot:gene5779-6367_t